MMNDMQGMGGMGWMMGGMAVIWLLIIVVLVLAIAAPVKYLRSKRCGHRTKARVPAGQRRRATLAARRLPRAAN